MRAPIVLMLAALLAFGGCGDDEGMPASSRPEATGTALIVADSEFGRMLFGADKQAIYIFENDSDGESR